MHIGQIFGVYRAEFKCKKCRLIRRLHMQNAVVFNTYCTYISRILGTNLIYTIKAAEKLNIWLNLTNLYIHRLADVKKGLVKNPRYTNSGDTYYGVVLSFSELRFW